LIFGIFGVLYVVFRGPQSTVPEDPYAFRPGERNCTTSPSDIT
jgi:hypothetical protein